MSLKGLLSFRIWILWMCRRIEIKYVIDPRRPGDIAACYADPTKAKEMLGWVAENGIFEMCRDSNNWQSKNPNGYDS